ncbi:MAG: DUF1822 family protein, partial [Cyanobacteria bacterium J06632_3]
QWPALVERYQGHPLALKSVARIIREMFNGRVDAFLAQPSVLFQDIARLIAPSFERLSVSETNILYWLSAQEVPLSLTELQQTLPLTLKSPELISALDSLKQRSLLLLQPVSDPPSFYLPALVKAYAFDQLMNQFKVPTNQQLETTERQAGSYGSSVIPIVNAPVINLSPQAAKLTMLSQWFAGQFDDLEWRSLDWLFESATQPATRLRNTYHLLAKTLLKRCKLLTVGDISGQLAGSSEAFDQTSAQTSEKTSEHPEKSSAAVILLMAVQQDADDVYQVYVQIQPGKSEDKLPEKLTLKLVDAQDEVLATAISEQNDTFIQLPYFRGAISEAFDIEITLGEFTHIERFVV